MAGARRLADIDHLVHGVLIALMGVMTLGFLHLTQRLGFERPAAAAGFVAFAGGSLLVCIAATFDGFVVPDFVAAWCTTPGQACAGSGTGHARPDLARSSRTSPRSVSSASRWG